MWLIRSSMDLMHVDFSSIENDGPAGYTVLTSLSIASRIISGGVVSSAATAIKGAPREQLYPSVLTRY